MKKNLLLTLLLAMFMVSCQDNAISGFDEPTPAISRSTAPTPDETNVSRYTVRIRNLNPNFTPYIHWEVTDTQYVSLDVNATNVDGWVYYNSDFVGYFEVAPGTYILEAVAENLGHIAVECEFNAENGGEIFLELEEVFGGWQSSSKWKEPIYIPFK